MEVNMDDYLAEQLMEFGLDPADYEHLEEFEIKEMLAELGGYSK
jgi:hypothetical protein